MAVKKGEYLVFPTNYTKDGIEHRSCCLTIPPLKYGEQTRFLRTSKYGPLDIDYETKAESKKRNAVVFKRNCEISLDENGSDSSNTIGFQDTGDSLIALESYVDPTINEKGNVVVPGFLWILNMVIDGLSAYDLSKWLSIIAPIFDGSVDLNIKDIREYNLAYPDLLLSSIVREFAASTDVQRYIQTINDNISQRMSNLPVYKQTNEYSFSDIGMNMDTYLASFIIHLAEFRFKVLQSLFQITASSYRLFDWFVNGPFTINMSIFPVLYNPSANVSANKRNVFPGVIGKQYSSNADTTGHIGYVNINTNFTVDMNEPLDTFIANVDTFDKTAELKKELLLLKPNIFYAVLPKGGSSLLSGCNWEDALQNEMLNVLRRTTPTSINYGHSAINGYEHGLAVDGALCNTRYLGRSTQEMQSAYQEQFMFPRFLDFEQSGNMPDDALLHRTRIQVYSSNQGVLLRKKVRSS